MRRALQTIAFLLLCCVGAVAGVAQQVKLPPVVRSKESNGIQYVLSAYRRAPMFSVVAVFPGGNAVEPEGKAGLAGLTATLLRRGTEKRTAKQIAEEMEFLGGSLSVAAQEDRIVVRLNALAKDAEAGLDILADVLRHPAFPAEELERERGLSLSALQSLAEDPGEVASYAEPGTLFGDHPYGRQATQTSLKNITRDDVLAYYRRHLVPNRLILVAVGEVAPAEMQAMLKARFGDWTAGEEATENASPVSAKKPQFVLIDKPDATQTQARFGRVGMPRNHPDYYAARVANTILGDGFTSRLTEEIRVNRSLTYSVGSGFRTLLQGGDFTISTFTKIETTRELLNATRALLQKTAQSGFSAEELNKAKGYLSGMFAIQMQTPQALAGQLADMAFYNQPNDYLQTYLPKLRAVSLAEVNRIAKTYFTPDALSIILVAPAEKVKGQLQGLPAFETRPVNSVGK